MPIETGGGGLIHLHDDGHISVDKPAEWTPGHPITDQGDTPTIPETAVYNFYTTGDSKWLNNRQLEDAFERGYGPVVCAVGKDMARGGTLHKAKSEQMLMLAMPFVGAPGPDPTIGMGAPGIGSGRPIRELPESSIPSKPGTSSGERPSRPTSDILGTPNRLQNKLSAWRRYNGKLNLGEWSRRYDQLQVNRARSQWSEGFGERGGTYPTPYGTRCVDNAPATEIKTGYQSATKRIRYQIIKDSYLSRTLEGYNPKWQFIDEVPSQPLIDKLDMYGIPYELPTR